MIAIRLDSGEIVVNPSLKSDRYCCRRLTALQGEVAGADQTAHLVVADPNRQAPQPHAGPCAVRLQPLGGRRPETRYIWWVIFRQRVSAGRYGVPQLKSSGPPHAQTKSGPSIARPSSTPRPLTTCSGPIRLHSQRIPPQGRASITTATSLAVHSAERGGGWCHNYFSHENSSIYRVTILLVTRYQLMIWMVASGRLVPPRRLT